MFYNQEIIKKVEFLSELSNSKKGDPFGPCLSVSKFKCPNISVLKMQKPFKV